GELGTPRQIVACDERMEKALEPVERLAIGEDDIGERGAIDLTGRGENAIAEARGEGVPNALVIPQQPMDEVGGPERRDAVAGGRLQGFGLGCADAACDGDREGPPCGHYGRSSGAAGSGSDAGSAAEASGSGSGSAAEVSGSAAEASGSGSSTLASSVGSASVTSAGAAASGSAAASASASAGPAASCAARASRGAHSPSAPTPSVA